MTHEFDELLTERDQSGCIDYLVATADGMWGPATGEYSYSRTTQLMQGGIYVELFRKASRAERVAKSTIIDCVLFVPQRDAKWATVTEEGEDDAINRQEISGNILFVNADIEDSKLIIQHWAGRVVVNAIGDVELIYDYTSDPEHPDPLFIGTMPRLSDQMYIHNLEALLLDVE